MTTLQQLKSKVSFIDWDEFEYSLFTSESGQMYLFQIINQNSTWVHYVEVTGEENYLISMAGVVKSVAEGKVKYNIT